MFGKVAIVALFAIFAVPGDASDDVWTGLTTKYSSYIKDPHRRASYFELPLTYADAMEQGWTSLKGATNLPGVTALGYRGDARYAIVFNSTTHLATGFQVAFPADEVAYASKRLGYDGIRGLTKKLIDDTEYWAAGIYYLTNGDGTRKAYYKHGTNLVEIPTDVAALKRQGLYLKKECFNGRGLYYSRITSATTSATLFPWNLMISDGQVVGFWFTAMGHARSDPFVRWYEQFDTTDLQMAIPDASESLLEDVRRFGLFSSHTWLSDKPWNIIC